MDMNQKVSPDVKMAQEYINEITANPRIWADMEILHFPALKFTRVQVGDILSNGIHERAFKYRKFMLNPDNTVSIHDEIIL